jgi:hypothetical protein
MTTLADKLISVLRERARAFTSGDEVRPCAVLWLDPKRLWSHIVPQLMERCPELFAHGAYEPEGRTGPAIWLRYVEADKTIGALGQAEAPIFYVPDVSREQLRNLEECRPEILPLVELCYRGQVWLHVNGREWTPYAFLTSDKKDALGLDIAADEETKAALQGALPAILDIPVTNLMGRKLDAEYFNGLLAPDPVLMILQWFAGPEKLKSGRPEPQWQAFRNQCRRDYKFDPDSDGPGKAASLLAARKDGWGQVWTRFCEAPGRHPAVTEWLETSGGLGVLDSAEVSPSANQAQESALEVELKALAGLPRTQVAQRIAELEAEHGMRRTYPWAVLGRAPLALALKPLADLAGFCRTTPGAPDPNGYGDYHAREGWRVDAAALAVMASCRTLESQATVLGVLRALYLPWLDETARHLQALFKADGRAPERRQPEIAPQPGRVVVFADGLRMDVGQMLAERLKAMDGEASVDWEWSTVPSVTATAKPAASPIDRRLLEGRDSTDEFTPRLVESGALLNQERLKAELVLAGWQCLAADETGDPAGSAWVEAGTLDKRGHDEGWKLALSVDAEVEELASRIRALFRAGWTEVVVVTDHGWLLVPGGMDKIELSMKLADHRWGRCAAIKTDTPVDVPVFRWTWNPAVSIASPHGVGCFRAGIEYSHGGVSLQEMVVPVIRVSMSSMGAASPRISTVQWTKARCRVTVANAVSGSWLDLREQERDPHTSLLADKSAVRVSDSGSASLFLEDLDVEGRAGYIVLMDSDMKVIHSCPTTLGV